MWRDDRATLRPECATFFATLVLLNRARSILGKRFQIYPAERVGFEPTVQFNPYDDLANRSFRPLRHLSGFALIQLTGGKSKVKCLIPKTITYLKRTRLQLHGRQLYFLLKFDNTFFEKVIGIHKVFYGLTTVNDSCMVSATEMFTNGFQ